MSSTTTSHGEDPPWIGKRVAVIRLLMVLPGFLLLVQCGGPALAPCPAPVSRTASAGALEIARAGWHRLDHPDPEVRGRAAASYNTAVADLFDRVRCGPGGWDEGARSLGTRWPSPEGGDLHPSAFDEIFPAFGVPVDRIGDRQVKSGLGVPLVGWLERRVEAADPFAAPVGDAVALSALLRFDGPVPEWHLFQRAESAEVAAGGRRFPLAYDLSAPHALYWRSARLESRSLINVFRPGRDGGSSRLFFGESYDPGKIPLVLVHGLQSSPHTFGRLANGVLADPGLRERYQIWYYYYPTGNPWPYSATIFREWMRAAGAYARANGGGDSVGKMVVVAHSMGGLLTRASISRPENALYERTFSKPFAEITVPDEVAPLFREYFFHEPLEDPARVIFLAVPHRGSPMAERYFAHFLARLIRLPLTITALALQMVTLNFEALAETGRDQLPTGISSLSPNAPSVLALQEMPIRRGVPFHSVIGDTGEPGEPSGTDGVVPSWSSRLPGAASERVVPADHSLTGHPMVIDEVKRLLHLHLRALPGPNQ